jgi:signal transduction histidine kinase
MNLKRRLLLSNTITMILPFIITFVVGICFIAVSSMIFEKDMSYKNFKQLTLIKTELFSISNTISKQNAQEAITTEFQQYLSQRLGGLKGEFIITKGNQVRIASSGVNKFDKEIIAQEVKNLSLEKTFKMNNKPYFVQETGLMLEDGTKINVILLAPAGRNLDIFGFLIIIIFVFIVAVVTVNLLMSYLFSKRILKPVTGLKAAATEISSGNLQCEILEDGDEEIKGLCHEFERMRVQLKDSIHMRMKYDDNRNMLVSSISHDLRTPLSSIKGYVEGILDGVANTPEKLESYLKTIYSKTEHIDGMIDDLLLYSKLDLNQLPFHFERTDILEYFKFNVSEIALELDKTNINIEIKSELDDIKYIMLDRERMRRVIVNIIDNSRKYMDKEHGRISVMLRQTNLSIIIEVRDNGAGIEKSELDKVFDRFYRADSARSEADGSGLGLAIAKQIVEGHKGKIWVVSHGENGTSILMSFAKIIGE